MPPGWPVAGAFPVVVAVPVTVVGDVPCTGAGLVAVVCGAHATNAAVIIETTDRAVFMRLPVEL
jgi:hypothetical protein